MLRTKSSLKKHWTNGLSRWKNGRKKQMKKSAKKMNYRNLLRLKSLYMNGGKKNVKS